MSFLYFQMLDWIKTHNARQVLEFSVDTNLSATQVLKILKPQYHRADQTRKTAQELVFANLENFLRLVEGECLYNSNLTVCLSVCPFVCPFVYLSVCRSTFTVSMCVRVCVHALETMVCALCFSLFLENSRTDSFGINMPNA